MTPTPEERAAKIYDEMTPTPSQSHIAMIAAEIRAAVADALRWIPVDERVPANGDLIELGWAGLPVSKVTKFYRVRVFENATHWRLFSPPTKEQPND